MKLRKPLIITAIALTSVFAGGATPASADTTGANATFELTGGAVTVTVGATSPLIDEPSQILTNDITGVLNEVMVTDLRGVDTPWVATASSSSFVGAKIVHTTSTSVSYMAGIVDEDGTIADSDVLVASVIYELGAPVTANVVQPLTLSGNNTASWTPTLVVTMPAGALADLYTGTITTSVA